MRSPRCLLVALSLAACGPAVTYDVPPNENPNGSATAGPGSGAAPAAAGDETVTLATPIDIKGQSFEPQALDTYGVNGAGPKKPTTLDQERKTFAAQKDALLKQAHATILATMLYQDAGKNPANKDADYAEAKQALSDAVEAAKGKADELDLELLGRYSQFSNDYAGAEKAWEAVVTQNPKAKEVELYKAWWAYSRLKQFKNADALALLDKANLNKTPELAYVASWAKYRTGDSQGAWDAMKIVAKEWNTQAALRENPDRMIVIQTEAMRLGARAGIGGADIATLVTPLFGKGQGEQYDMWKKIADAMRFAGRWADAISASDQALQIGGAKTPPDELVTIPLAEMEYETRLDDPAGIEKDAQAALTALPNCGAPCTPEAVQNVLLTVAGTATLMHSVYAAANDPRYYQPAHDLYGLTTAKITDPARRQTQESYMGRLEGTHKLMKPNTGRLGTANVGNAVNSHNQEIQACYEQVLSGSPKVAGALSLTLDIQQDGTVRGATSDPKGGQADLSAVASCAVDRAKSWKFPARGSAGSTRATVKYALAVRGGGAAAGAGGGGAP